MNEDVRKKRYTYITFTFYGLIYGPESVQNPHSEIWKAMDC